jgi:hypothetical protein
MGDVTSESPHRQQQDPTQQPGGDPELEFGPRAPSMPQYFAGYAVVFLGVVAFALALVGLMHVLR